MKYKMVFEKEEVSKLVKQKGIGKVAAMVGVSRQYMDGAVRGRYVVTYEFYEKVLKALFYKGDVN